jgi:hypothetical protein
MDRAENENISDNLVVSLFGMDVDLDMWELERHL